MGETIVLPAQEPRRVALEADGWVIVARSFGAQLNAGSIDDQRLRALVAGADGSVRELGDADVDAVLHLDAMTIEDYPGSAATQHTPLDRRAATPGVSRRAFGAFGPDGKLVAMTFVDVDRVDAETHFTVVHRAWRGRGLGIAVKAASVLTLAAERVTRFRTGGSADNAAILRANTVVGYIRDEEWVTLAQDAR
jgi:GNAT superfamily N-acetyltransferase